MFDEDDPDDGAAILYRRGYEAGAEKSDRERNASSSWHGRKPPEVLESILRRLREQGRPPEVLELVRRGYEDGLEGRPPAY